MRLKAAGWVLVVTIAAVAAGCATTQKKAESEPQKPDAAAAREAAVRDAVRDSVRLMETGSTAPLSRAAGLLSAESVAGDPRIAEVAGYGARLFGLLYPDLENPFARAGSSAAPTTGAAVSDFFGRLDPALSLLAPGPRLSEDAANDLLNTISQADGLRPDSVLPPYLRALLLERQERPPEAIRPVFEECIRRDPAFYPAKQGIMRAVIAQGAAASELPLLAKDAAELPSPSLTYAALAQANLAAGKPHQAADAAARALLMTPDSPDLVIIRARAFEAMGDWYQALAVLDALLSVKPDEPRALELKATILFEKAGNPDAAMQVVGDAEGRFPNDPAFPELRGRILLSRGNSALGDAALNRALRLDPLRGSTLALLADSSARSERWQEAAEYLSKIPSWLRTADDLRLGWQIAMSLGDYDQALSFARALGKKAGGDEPLLLSARAVLAAGKIPEALDLIAKDLPAVSTPASRSTLYTLRALAERQTGGNDAALADLRLALRENPDDIEALVAITDILGDAGDYRRALNYLKHARELAPSDAALHARYDELARRAESEN